jgi:hypothetical protein
VQGADVRFGSEADICAATSDVCFTPDSDRESRHAAMVMSALPLKVDVCDANRQVCFGPEADIGYLSIIPSVSNYFPAIYEKFEIFPLARRDHNSERDSLALNPPTED